MTVISTTRGERVLISIRCLTKIIGHFQKRCVIIVKHNDIYSTKKLRISQKTMNQKNTKTNNYSIFIYLFRYLSSVKENVSFSLLALKPLLWHSVSTFDAKRDCSRINHSLPTRLLFKCKGTVDSCLFLTVRRDAIFCYLFQNVQGTK